MVLAAKGHDLLKKDPVVGSRQQLSIGDVVDDDPIGCRR
jgi:hypothetical protein